MPKDFLQGASLTPTFEALMVKFGGKIGTLYQMLKNVFKKHPLQNRTNVQIKGGGVKGLLNNVQKNCTFLTGGHPLLLRTLTGLFQLNTLEYYLWWYCTLAANLSRYNIVVFPGVNKKPKKIKTVWHGFRIILKLSGRVNQARLKLSAGFSNTVCWTSNRVFVLQIA